MHRLPTYGKPRIICCASLEARFVVLPRGCLREAIDLLESNGIHVELKDHRGRGAEVQVRFLGTLRDEQRRAVEALSAHEFGVLAATTAFGKTVQLGALLLTATLEGRPEVGFDSYDRLFPSQGTLPKGGLGNLIALPLQREARDVGNSVFEDQWAALSSFTRIPGAAVRELVDDAETHGRVLGVRIPEAESDAEEPWRMPPSRRTPEPPVAGPLPSRVQLVLADELYVDRSALPPS